MSENEKSGMSLEAPPAYPGQPGQQGPTPYPYVTQANGQAGYQQFSAGMQLPPGTQTVIHVSNVMAPQDYFSFALFVTICCCLPFGIVALIKSSEVKNRARMGDMEGAAASSQQAKGWSIAGLVFGICIIVSVCVIYGVLIAIAASTY